MYKFSGCVAVLLTTGLQALGQTSESSRGFTWYERFEGSVNTLGAVTRLDSTVGYNFDSHFSVAGGVPVYFVRPSSSTTAATGTHSFSGIGNAYGQFQLTLANPVVDFASTITVTAPTGDEAIGLSTGHVTVDWSNYFERTFSRLTPFGDIGFSNSISDTAFFIRPYETYGSIAHWQAGARYRLVHSVSAAGSFYGVEPLGEQTLVSRLSGVFGSGNVATGPDLTRDHGLSAWAEIGSGSHVSFYGGYTHSTKFSLDTVFFGVGVSMGKVLRHWGI
ncbi:MAG: hypothetical protein C5B51_28035 [Terriglobia bacterium]|nr:MAG: hypothetical protein C5B51_28035 [Terriglobia bacterium]